MIIRWQYPLFLFIQGPSPETLDLAGEFRHKDAPAKYELLGDKPYFTRTPEGKDVYYRMVRTIRFQIDDTKLMGIQESDYPRLFKLAISVMNRVLCGIRNSGIVTAACEINPQESEANKLFIKWALEVSEDGKVWTRLLKEDPAIGWISALFPENTSELDSSLWPEIEESIQDNILPPPEREFFVNCIEYLKNRNFRMAVVESVTCLDIVTSQYLNIYLASYKKIPKDRIERFLQPQLGLAARVSVLLDLCLHPDDIKNIGFNNVLQTIKWRNKIIHNSGRLPKELPDNEIVEGVTSVLALTSVLSQARNQVESMPELQEIGKKISDKTSAPRPDIWVYGKHKVKMDFSFFIVLSEFPGNEKLELILGEAIRLLSERDRRFKPEEHLYIRFFKFPGELKATWSKGKLVNVPVAAES